MANEYGIADEDYETYRASIDDEEPDPETLQVRAEEKRDELREDGYEV